jgi:hypothetical protein
MIDAAKSLLNAGQALIFNQQIELLAYPTGDVFNPDTGAFDPPSSEPELRWSGLGSVQAVRKATTPFLDAGREDTRQVYVPFLAFVPYAASPERDWMVRCDGQLYMQLTQPVDPGGAGGYWELRLSAPVGSADV